MRHQKLRSRSRIHLLLTPALLIATAGLVGCGGGGHGAGSPGDVSGRYLITVDDADMAAASFSDKMLGDRNPNARDSLTVVALPITEPVTKFAQIEVSNSALCPPTCLAVLRDG